MLRSIDHYDLPVVNRHDLVMTLLEGEEPFNGHCTCDRWSHCTNDWIDLGARWARHYVAASEGPGGHPFTRKPAAVVYDHRDNCECPGCWEATVARRHVRDANCQHVACPHCGCCVACDDPVSPNHEDCVCPIGRAVPVEVAA